MSGRVCRALHRTHAAALHTARRHATVRGFLHPGRLFTGRKAADLPGVWCVDRASLSMNSTVVAVPKAKRAFPGLLFLWCVDRAPLLMNSTNSSSSGKNKARPTYAHKRVPLRILYPLSSRTARFFFTAWKIVLTLFASSFARNVGVR